jgi:hypothetical protein
MLLKFYIIFLSILTSSNEKKTQNYKVHLHPTFVSKSYDFSNDLSCHATPSDATEQYCHDSGSGVTAFFTSKMSSNVAYVATPIHVTRQHYLIAPAPLQKGQIRKKKGAIIIKILNKND